MKRALLFILSVFFALSFLGASLSGRISISEEIAYQKYNKIWESPSSQYYSVESIASNPTLGCGFEYLFGNTFGITMESEFGYQFSIDDKNRFVTFPKNINGTIGTGIVIDFRSVSFSLSALLRSSFQLSRNAWVSQVGGKIGVAYTFPCGMNLNLYYKYFSSYEMITSAFAFGLGYQFGGKK